MGSFYKSNASRLVGAAILLAALLGGGYYFSRPGRVLQRFMPGCVGCHVRVTLQLDGLAASRLSKGTHPVNLAKIRPLKGLAREDWQFFSEADLSGQTCAMCHPDQHQSWSASAHGRAFRNEIFQHAYKRDREGWCLNCHAPLWEPERMDAVAIAERPDMQAPYAQGVTCVVCHLRDGQIVSGTDYSAKKSQLFHPVRYDPQFKKETFCAGCHQFNFIDAMHPVVVYEGDEHPMQNVVHEFQAGNGSLYPDSCVGCHFYKGDHGLKSEGRSDLRQKMTIKLAWQEAAPTTPATLQLALGMPHLAHHFPTGDLFRILSFYAFDAQQRQLLQYDFRKEVRVVDRAVVRNSTLKPAPDQHGALARLSFELPERPVRCRLVYRLQGTIDTEIEQDFADPGVLYDVLYDGPCSN